MHSQPGVVLPAIALVVRSLCMIGLRFVCLRQQTAQGNSSNLQKLYSIEGFLINAEQECTRGLRQI